MLTDWKGKQACGDLHKTRHGSSFQALTKEFCWMTSSRQHLQWKQLIAVFKKHEHETKVEHLKITVLNVATETFIIAIVCDVHRFNFM